MRIVGIVWVLIITVGLALSSLVNAPAAKPVVGANGIIMVKSAYAIEETIARLKSDIAGKGIMFFTEIDQAKLAGDAGIKLNPSILLIFGNPPLGGQFMTSNPVAGIDWPVRLLVIEDVDRTVWAVYTDFNYIANRHGIRDRGEQFKMAATVIASITSSVAAK
jgi:uncharacterized protein (DUF302 family)